jgi:hypothetical protein
MRKHTFPGKQRIIRVDYVTNEEEYNQFDELPFFIDTNIVNLIETRLTYSSMIPNIRTDDNGKLVQG